MKIETEMRELDAWIADHVMGFLYRSDKPKRWEVRETNEVYFVNTDGDDHLCWCPTIHGDDALAVLEKCREHVKAKSDSEHQYSVRIDCDYPFTIYELESKFMECRFRVEDESLPLAICLFAKKLFS